MMLFSFSSILPLKRDVFIGEAERGKSRAAHYSGSTSALQPPTFGVLTTVTWVNESMVDSQADQFWIRASPKPSP